MLVIAFTAIELVNFSTKPSRAASAQKPEEHHSATGSRRNLHLLSIAPNRMKKGPWLLNGRWVCIRLGDESPFMNRIAGLRIDRVNRGNRISRNRLHPKVERRTMCEANAYLLKGGQEELFLESVDVLENAGQEIRVTSIFGEQKTVKGQIRRMSLVDHKIIIEEQ
jgi:predicted RNA-binding protein